ncbi:MarR family winged helix-turn-helix transcriptional regulator [Olivibacter jilunii]|uniref:MarR family winged helix-turn-helix transcriptional regulator n=1 Tax=Olivibacter jilunii TaxID=985016 RepID=UPI003F146264
MLKKETELSKSWVRLIYSLKKDIDDWAEVGLRDLWPGKFQLSYMQVFIYIDERGVTNKFLAQQARVSKQAMSRIIMQMEKSGVVKVETQESDKRYSIISATPFGREIMLEAEKRLTLFLRRYFEPIDQPSIAAHIEILSKLVK